VIALSLDYADYPWRWASWLAPAFMYRILVHVTDIPPLEDQMLRSRGERYRDYQSRTSRLFPLPPRKVVVT
jgi:steroid 5-alpha reductase family enzyme